MTVLRSFGSRLIRTKHIEKGDLSTNLRRCLNTFDITMMGVGSMVGAGIYVTSGEVMRHLAGASAILSYAVAGLAAFLSALCYAEFGARYPKAGSAYTYAYVGCGEIWAFVIGWNVILEQALNVSTSARLFAGNLEDLVGFAVREWTVEHARIWPWSTVSLPDAASASAAFQEGAEICVATNVTVQVDRPVISYYPDFIALAITCFMALFVGIGSRATSNLNVVFCITNLTVICGVVGYGLTFADLRNWKNFAPCGMNGVLAGASKCFFTYIGFDALATAGEEARNPTKMIPRATYYSMTLVTTCYVLMAGTLSLMLPYTQLAPTSVYSSAFLRLGAPRWITGVIAFGALAGILTTIMAALFALPRAVYAMAEDGLLFAWWARVNGRTKTPLNATITFTLLAGLIAMTFDLSALIEFLSIGTIMAYTIVAAALILLRYRPVERSPGAGLDQGGRIRPGVPLLPRLLRNVRQGSCVLYALVVMMTAFTLIGVVISNSLYEGVAGLGLLIALILIAALSLLFIDAHEQNSVQMDYKVGCVPYLPAGSLLINLVMMTQLTWMTWVRLAVWMTLGLAIYFAYGMQHSKEEERQRSKGAPAVHAKLQGDWRITAVSIDALKN